MERDGVLEGSHKITAFTKDGKIHPEFPKKFFDLITDIDTPILLTVGLAIEQVC